MLFSLPVYSEESTKRAPVVVTKKFLPSRQLGCLLMPPVCLPLEHKQLLKNAQLELKKSKRKDYYKILGVDKNASEDEIKKAYRKRALMHHPGERCRRMQQKNHSRRSGHLGGLFFSGGEGCWAPVLQIGGGATFQTWTIVDFVFLCPWSH